MAEGPKANKIIPVQFRHAIAAFADLFNSKTVRVLQSLMENEVVVGSHGRQRWPTNEKNNGSWAPMGPQGWPANKKNNSFHNENQVFVGSHAPRGLASQ